MKTITDELSVFFDCDLTLVFPADEQEETSNVLDIDYYGTPKQMIVHVEHIDLLKSYRARGYYVVVWSNNGSAYAAQIIKKLKLEKYVHECRTKPTKLVDDQSVGEAFGQRVFIPFMGVK